MVETGIKEEVEKISIVDTHEHIMPEAERNKYAVDIGYLFSGYSTSDLISAGMPPRLMEAFRLPMYRYHTSANAKHKRMRRFFPEPEREDMSLEERWQAVEPFWEAIRNTAYSKQLLIAIQDLFGVDDLNRDTYHKLSQAIAHSRQPGWYYHVMKEKANIAISIVNVNLTDVDRELFVPVMCLDHFADIRSRQELVLLEEEASTSIHSLDDLVKAMQKVLEGYVSNGAVGVKSLLAYFRPLQYDKVTHNQAEIVFNRMQKGSGEWLEGGPSFSEMKPLQDYMIHQVIRATIELHLPLQIHTGFHEGNENIITNSNPTRLINLFIEYREAKFVLFHGGYPYIHEWALLAKTFANVYADLCFVHVLSPEVYRRLLHELVETVPGNKIMTFGGDAHTVERAYGHSRVARQAVARVLSEKVSEGYMRENEAIVLAQRILRDNAAILYQLFHKRDIV